VNVSEGFIKRPIATTLLMGAIALFGTMAYRTLPVSDLPNVDMPTLQVTANLPGASPETMASTVATPLERQFSTIDGLESMSSSNRLGTTQITLQFAMNRDLDGVAQDVQTAISGAARLLPAEMPAPPNFRKQNPADQPILFMAMRSPTVRLSDLSDYADTFVSQRLSQVSGVSQIGVGGNQLYAVRIQIDPRALAARSIGMDEIQQAIQRQNVNIPGGTLYGPDKMVTVQATGQLRDAAGFRKVVIAYRNEAPVRLEDVADVTDGVEDDKQAGWFYGEGGGSRSIILQVMKQPGANAVEVAEAVKELIPAIRQQLPASVTLEMIYDRSQTIRSSFEDIKNTMLLTLVLVIMVIFLFLRNIPATIIPSLALPFSVVGTFAAMYFFGFSLNNLSMMALILAVGFVVDDAIVVLENIVRHLEHGETPMRAALNGSREVGFTVISMTLSLAAVFIPLLFMGGILGRVFREFAVTIAVAIIISGIVSVTLTPMLASRFLKVQTIRQHGAIYRWTESIFDGMLAFYEWTLKAALAHRPAILLAMVAILGGTAYLAMLVPKGFLPSEDTDQVQVTTEARQGVSHTQMFAAQEAMAARMQKDPNVTAFMSMAGGQNGTNGGRMFLHLKPRDERTRKQGIEPLIQEMRMKMNDSPTMRVFMQNPPSLRIGSFNSRSQYQLTLQGTDLAELYSGADRMEQEMAKIPGLIEVSSNLQIKNPEAHVVIDRNRAASLGVTPEQIESSLYSAYGPRQVSTIYTANNQYRVVMEVKREYQADPSLMSMLYVRSSQGRLIPLDAVARIEQAVGPLAMNHVGQLPGVTLSFNLRPGVSLGEATDQVQELADRILPATVTTSFQGTAQAFQQSMKNLPMLMLLAILVVYIVLGILYESFIHPLTILSGLPAAGFGALLTLYLFDMELGIYAFVGLILLIGIVKKNAIMQIDFALNAERNEGMTPHEAIYRGCVVRFRPIMMTTAAALFGALPIAIGFGASGEGRRPLGMAVAGGLIFSQLVTLYLTPVIYTYLARFQGKHSLDLPEESGLREGRGLSAAD
jgi:hydrophobic/amphiphilic exporter-1 (mainly G- bacteria), HAE1 family